MIRTREDLVLKANEAIDVFRSRPPHKECVAFATGFIDGYKLGQQDAAKWTPASVIPELKHGSKVWSVPAVARMEYGGMVVAQYCVGRGWVKCGNEVIDPIDYQIIQGVGE